MTGWSASAPVRLDFAGGWTDVPPFASREGGVVVNAAIGLRGYASFEPGGGQGILVHAEDLQESARVHRATDLDRPTNLTLHRAALRMFPVGPGTLRTRSDVPLGSGLGSSGAMDVAMVAVLAAARGEELSPEDVAAHGCHLEVVEAGHPGGRQDQYAAALGGFHRLNFQGDEVRTNRLNLDPAFLGELERRTLICYTGRSRVSGETIARVMAAYERGDASVSAALRELTTIAERMAEALLAADLPRVAALLTDNWRCQQRLDAGMRTDEMAELEAAMQAAGALGGKAAGAGAGGSMFFLMGDDIDAGIRAAEQAGATLLPASWSATGVERC
jgi:D-glycero-alpha-D-manno-heptose-7-phosphate kinase